MADDTQAQKHTEPPWPEDAENLSGAIKGYCAEDYEWLTPGEYQQARDKSSVRTVFYQLGPG